ncbi:hypothetical protein CWE09_10570 [Aliidiomarina minuta]|uniref:Transglutaminase-like domain-containing protein n=2 Tax=Aliidiomarina minuta TaxID=880057 RepID=A0A432W485_9GAMM|nr:hypothetical protein CWE09_10570 [Aliidiomarina minuta]
MSSVSWAEQFFFQRQAENSQLNFAYQWRDLDNHSRQISFQVPQTGFLQTPVNFRPLSPARIHREIKPDLRSFAHDSGWRDVEINLPHGGESIEINLRSGTAGQRQQRMQALLTEKERLQQEIMHRNYYNLLVDHARRQGFKPDHVRIAEESHPAVQSLAEAFANKLGEDSSPYDSLRLILSFVQTIPYAELDNRFSSPGAGFHTPARLLFENRGDCDSKVTLIAALFSALHPQTESLIVYLPGHAMFAVDIEPGEDDYWVRHDERRFLLTEPTGPARFEPGRIGDRYVPHVYNGALVVEAF